MTKHDLRVPRHPPAFRRESSSNRPSRFGLLAFVAVAIVLVATLTGPDTTSAAEPVVTDLEVQVPKRLTVGDRVRYVITVEVDKGAVMSLAPAGLPEALSQTRRLETRTRDIGGGRSELTLTLEVAPFVPGQLDIPPLRLRYRGPGTASGEVETPASRLTVDSVLPAGGVLHPRDLKPQAEIGAASPAALITALILLGVALLVLLALLVWRLQHVSPQRTAEAEPAADALSPEDRARRTLDGAADLLARPDYAAYYSTLAITVRTYLTERFGFPAFASTTTELQERMVREGMDRWQARLVAGLLNQCDAVVFAQYRPAPERADADLTAAYEIVEMTRPVQEQPAIEVGAS